MLYFRITSVGILLSLILNLFGGAKGKEEKLAKPLISYKASTGYDYHNPGGNYTKTTANYVVVPSNVRMFRLICNASYPVTWTIHDQVRTLDNWAIGLRTSRLATNIYDPTTFKYSAELSFYVQMESPWTGNYTCKNTAKEDVQASMYLFWEGTTALLHNHKNLTIYVEEDGLAVMPCIQARKTKSKPTLQKKIGDSYQNLALNKTLVYDTARGFLLSHAQNLTGRYKCIAPGGDQDWVNFDVKYINESFIPPSKNSKANFTYDPVKRTLKCCSSTKRSPKLINLYCKHPSLCAFKSLFTMPPQYYSYNKFSKKGCSRIKLYSHSAGVAHCLGDGIDMIKQYVFPMRYSRIWTPLNETVPAYMHWNEINDQEMIILRYEYVPPRYNHYYDYGYYPGNRRRNQEPEPPMYDGELLNFICEPSTYYYAEGVHWSIKWKNHSVQFINSTDPMDYNYNHFHGSGSSALVKLHLDMESVICIAPVWNTSVYVYKTFHVYVNASKPTVLKGEQTTDESLTWVMNDTSKSIVCEAQGIPTPTISWIKTVDSQNYSIEYNHVNISSVVNNRTNTITDTLLVHRVSHDTAGIYICTASNLVSSVSRQIEVEVTAPTSWKKSVAIIVGIIVVLSLGVGLGLLYFKMSIDKKVIKQLSPPVGYNNSSRNNASNQEGVAADLDNARYDTPKIHSNLLN